MEKVKHHDLAGCTNLLAASCLLICCLLASAQIVYADTDGTELQVMQPSQLEIQLGTQWAGVEFQLKTDAGLYPGTIPVSEDGILRLEIGGSSAYTLSCMNSTTPIPSPTDASPVETQTPATNEPADAPINGETGTPPAVQSARGIPMTNIILFGTGLAVAIGVLIALKNIQKRRNSVSRYGEDDEDEYDDE